VIGMDKDPRALAAASARLARYGEAFRAVRGDFRDARNVLSALGLDGVDGALVDLGVSSPQLDDAARGFSFREGGPLDMRMGPEGQTLADLLARLDERELARVIREYGEERFARPVARAVKRALASGQPLDTARLAEVVAGAIPRKAWPPRIHPATRTFQALRIRVNRELDGLGEALERAAACLRPGGRMAVIAFHSLEDRAAKEAFRALAARGFRLLTKKPVRPGEAEVRANPRARSARLRAVAREEAAA
jgi:16S rRNA (cytosine1402-N4)-methyltransferase